MYKVGLVFLLVLAGLIISCTSLDEVLEINGFRKDYASIYKTTDGINMSSGLYPNVEKFKGIDKEFRLIFSSGSPYSYVARLYLGDNKIVAINEIHIFTANKEVPFKSLSVGLSTSVANYKVITVDGRNITPGYIDNKEDAIILSINKIPIDYRKDSVIDVAFKATYINRYGEKCFQECRERFMAERSIQTIPLIRQ